MTSCRASAHTAAHELRWLPAQRRDYEQFVAKLELAVARKTQLTLDLLDGRTGISSYRSSPKRTVPGTSAGTSTIRRILA